MKVEVVETFINQIMNGMKNNYNYNIENFSFLQGTFIPWGLWKIDNDGNKKILLFMDIDQDIFNGDYENYICSKVNCNRENLIKVVLISEERNSDYIEGRVSYLRSIGELEFNFIILDLVKKQIQVSDSNMDIIQNQIVDIVNNNQGTNNNEKTAAPVTNILIGINIVMFIISVILSKSIMDINTEVLVNLGAKSNMKIENGQWFRLVTCMFLHGGLVHIAVNMYSLYAVGPFVEQLYGKFKYILVYFISGIMSSLFSFWFSPYVSIGASGAIFGLLGVIFVFAIKERKRVGRNFLVNIASVIGINLFIGLSLSGIDNFGHLGGLIGGVTFGLIASLIDKR